MVALVCAGLLAGCARSAASEGASPRPAAAPAPAPLLLPGGGTQVFPKFRVVAYYGTAGGPGMGVLGSQPPDQIADRLSQAAAAFATPGRPVQPAMELIATIADRAPGPDGSYSHSINPAVAWDYLKAARAHRQLLILDLQPGYRDFLAQAREWEPLLAQPDVSLALDPEWRMSAGGVPGMQIGQVSAAEVNTVSAWLSGLVRTHHLPQKLFVLHEFTPDMITDIAAVAAHAELADVQQLDGFGSSAVKIAKYRDLGRPQQFHLGFKLFYTDDIGLLPPPAVLGLAPPPDYVSYQ
ncbi:hypothetical protein FOS14_07860 [Skermania sp. ID1734]|uniref:hypothetical protein n=1 Tax=Skermania sp. ID1734 TaxID=2597516 RepID=UPI00117F41E7|nr:hypothetical protein [Skermania sp. ID1734]TSE00334.1 hypothetical protein FOS14_07860 [Skermania sp. ID1734]